VVTVVAQELNRKRVMRQEKKDSCLILFIHDLLLIVAKCVSLDSIERL